MIGWDRPGTRRTGTERNAPTLSASSVALITETTSSGRSTRSCSQEGEIQVPIEGPLMEFVEDHRAYAGEGWILD